MQNSLKRNFASEIESPQIKHVSVFAMSAEKELRDAFWRSLQFLLAIASRRSWRLLARSNTTKPPATQAAT